MGKMMGAHNARPTRFRILSFCSRRPTLERNLKDSLVRLSFEVPPLEYDTCVYSDSHRGFSPVIKPDRIRRSLHASPMFSSRPKLSRLDTAETRYVQRFHITHN